VRSRCVSSRRWSSFRTSASAAIRGARPTGWVPCSGSNMSCSSASDCSSGTSSSSSSASSNMCSSNDCIKSSWCDGIAPIRGHRRRKWDTRIAMPRRLFSMQGECATPPPRPRTARTRRASIATGHRLTTGARCAEQRLLCPLLCPGHRECRSPRPWYARSRGPMTGTCEIYVNTRNVGFSYTYIYNSICVMYVSSTYLTIVNCVS